MKVYSYQYPNGINGINRLQGQKVNIFRNPNFLVPIFFFSLLASVRYKVGVDTESYKMIFYQYITGYDKCFLVDKGEWGFKFIIDITSFFSNQHYLYLFSLAAIQIGSLYFALRKQREYLPFLAVSIFLSEIFFILMNGMRQSISACLLPVMILFILEKKWLKAAMTLLIATSFHKSAVFLIPLSLSAFCLDKKILDTKWQLFLFFLSFLLIDKIPINLFSLSKFAGDAGYDDTQIIAYSSLDATSKSVGPIVLLQYVTYLIAIIYSKKMFVLFKSKFFNVVYNLFFIGLCLYLIFYNNFTVSRILYYFRMLSPIIVSASLYTLWTSSEKIDKSFFRITIILMVSYLLWELIKATTTYPNEYVLFKFDF